jgi:hypothetical protein
MRAKRFVVATLHIDGVELELRFADLVVVAHPEATEVDWELIALPAGPAALEPGAYHLELVTTDGRRLRGDAVLVRSLRGTHVLRGAGPLDGVTDAELR